MKQQKGFTLIELMIVIAIIGILAAVAVPQYGQYTKRAKFADVIASTNSIKTAVSLCYQETNTIEVCSSGEYPGIGKISGDSSEVLYAGEASKGFIKAEGGDPVDHAQIILDPGVTEATNGDPISWSVHVDSSCIKMNLCKSY